MSDTAPLQKRCVRAYHDPCRRQFLLWSHEHELIDPDTVEEARQDDNGFVDNLHGSVPVGTKKCYLVYHFYETSSAFHAFHLSYEDAKKQYDEEAKTMPIYEEEVRLTEDTREGHMLCTSCRKEQYSYHRVDKTDAVILRVIDLETETC